jgi:hypothetical protein
MQTGGVIPIDLTVVPLAPSCPKVAGISKVFARTFGVFVHRYAPGSWTAIGGMGQSRKEKFPKGVDELGARDLEGGLREF